jgi:diketogulonate reductase-like aldo/keto reductase
MGAMADLIDAGKIRFAGVSNFSVAQLHDAKTALGKHPLVSNQVRYNIIDRTIEKELLPYCQANRITVIAYSPLARGLARIRDCDPTGALDDVARATGMSPASIAINWCLSKDRVVAIPKGNSVEHILDNCAASNWRLSPGQIALLDSKIQHRSRNRFDLLLRRHIPGPLRAVALRTLDYLPRELRRRIT